MIGERLRPLLASCRVVTLDVLSGLSVLTHNTLALIGLGAFALLLLLMLEPAVLKRLEGQIHSVLIASQLESEPGRHRKPVLDPSALNTEQRRVAEWLARRHQVAVEPVAALVMEAESLARGSPVTAHLILSLIAVESGFHPFIESGAGAVGLMQVMRVMHKKRFEAYGGETATFDPIVNLRVGVQILNDFIRLQGGNVDAGLRNFLGGFDLKEDGGYVAKVRFLEASLNAVAAGLAVPQPQGPGLPAPGEQATPAGNTASASTK